MDNIIIGKAITQNYSKSKPSWILETCFLIPRVWRHYSTWELLNRYVAPPLNWCIFFFHGRSHLHKLHGNNIYTSLKDIKNLPTATKYPIALDRRCKSEDLSNVLNFFSSFLIWVLRTVNRCTSGWRLINDACVFFSLVLSEFWKLPAGFHKNVRTYWIQAAAVGAGPGRNIGSRDSQ